MYTGCSFLTNANRSRNYFVKKLFNGSVSREPRTLALVIRSPIRNTVLVVKPHGCIDDACVIKTIRLLIKRA